MGEISIISINERVKPLLETQYKGIRYNPLVWIAFKKRKISVEYLDGVLKFKTKKNKIDKSNMFMVEGFLRSKGFKKTIDYNIEVVK